MLPLLQILYDIVYKFLCRKKCKFSSMPGYINSSNMKRLLLLVFLFQFIINANSENKEFSRWSFSLEYGYNKFDGDINVDLTKLNPQSLLQTTHGANIEFAITPIWGLSLDYYYFPLRAKTNSPAVQIGTNLHNTDLNATINFTRLIFPQSKSRFYFSGAIGLGYAYYIYDVLPTSTVGLGSNTGNAISIPVIFTLEYNFSKPLSLGANLHYRAYNKDDLEGVKALNYKGVTNDFIGAGTLFLRYKFHSVSKDHLRNIKMNRFAPDEAMVLAQLNSERINRLDTAQNKLSSGISRLDTALAKLESKVDFHASRLDSLYVILSNDGPDTDDDGVPDVRDLEPDTPPNTPVDFWGKTLKIPVSFSVTVASTEDAPAVYFDFDRFTLDDNALVEISKIAAKMKKDPGLFLEVRGYCDYSGNNPYNQQLSQRRSDRVKAELVDVWKIPADHIVANGKGKVIEPRLSYRPNRRCDFFFGKL